MKYILLVLCLSVGAPVFLKSDEVSSSVQLRLEKSKKKKEKGGCPFGHGVVMKRSL